MDVDFMANLIPRFMRLRDILSATGSSRSTIYYMIAQGLWTMPVKFGERVSVWPIHEVTAINSAHMAGMSRQEIQALVKTLHEARRK